VEIWRRLGAPTSVTRVLDAFYDKQVRFVEWAGCVADQPIYSLRSLLQGCPASPLLLAGIIATWRHAIAKQHPTLEVGAYLDDRTIFGAGQDVVDELAGAFELTRRVDAVFGLQEHPAKRGLFGTTSRTRKELVALELVPGQTTLQFDLLGVTYNTTRRRACPCKEEAWAEAHRRAKRIAMGTRKRHLRAKLASSLVVRKVLWNAAWQRPTKRKLALLQSAIERCVFGTIVPERSRFLRFACNIAVELDLSCVIASEVLRVIRWRSRRQALGKPSIRIGVKINNLQP
jgi:hypothetical protein